MDILNIENLTGILTEKNSQKNEKMRRLSLSRKLPFSEHREEKFSR
ncbi:hypothetical protein VRK_07210 [Vibrio sp. MEBiC08052]|nr:hypothetical protein VRK_07210 [Vibrio sp. MEBiC08052]